MRKIGLWKSLLLGLVMAAGILCVNRLDTRAAAMPEMKSKGRIAWDNGTKDKSDDITVFDSKDIQYLYELADPNNDVLWRKEESGITRGKLLLSKNGGSVQIISSDKLEEIERYIKSIRSSSLSSGETSWTHYAFSRPVITKKSTGKTSGSSYSGVVAEVNSSKNNKMYFFSCDLGKSLTSYSDQSSLLYDSSEPNGDIRKRAFNSGYVRISGNGSTTGKITTLGYRDFYENNNPTQLYVTAHGSKLTSNESIKIYVDMNFKHREAASDSDTKPELPNISMPFLKLKDWEKNEIIGDLNRLLDYVDNTYATERVESLVPYDDYLLLKVGNVVLPQTEIQEFPIKFSNTSNEYRQVELTTNVSNIPGYENFSPSDFFLASDSFIYNLDKNGKKYFQFPVFPSSAENSDTDIIKYDKKTGDLTFIFLLASKLGQEVSGYTIDGDFDLFMSISPSKYTEMESLFSDSSDQYGVYDGFGQLIMDWNTLKTECLDLNGTGSTKKSFKSLMDDKNLAGLYNIRIPSTQTNIGYGTFDNAYYVSSVEFEEGLKNIYGYAFANNPLIKKIDLPNTLETIGSYAFTKDTGLKEVSFGESLSTLGPYGFYNCPISQIDLSKTKVKYVEAYCFSSSAGKKVVILPGIIETLGEGAFKGNSTDGTKCEEIFLPKSIKTIYKNCFNSNDYNGTTFIFEDGFNGDAKDVWTYEGGSAIYVLPSDLTRIGNYMLCNSQQIELPDTITSLGEGALYHYTGDYITLPESIKTIGERAFKHAYNIEEITIPYQVTKLNTAVFCGCSSLKVVNYEGKITAIPQSCFEACSSIQSIRDVLSDDVTTIGESAFKSCSSLTRIELADYPVNLQRVDRGIFWQCENIEYAEVPLLAKFDYASSMFAYCSNLAEVVLPEGITFIPWQFFWYCSSLKNVNIPSTVEVIKHSSFEECGQLEELILPEGLKTIYVKAFMYCTSLDITIPDGLEDIYNNRAGATEIDPRDLPFLEVKSVTYYGTLPGAPWGAKTFNGVPQ